MSSEEGRSDPGGTSSGPDMGWTTAGVRVDGPAGLSRGQRTGDDAGGPGLPLVDAAQIAMLRSLDQDGTRDLVGRVVTLFLQDLPRLLAQAEAARRADAPAEVARCAHTLKSASGNVGAARLAACARRLESAAKAGDVAELERLGAEIACTADETAAALRKVIQTPR